MSQPRSILPGTTYLLTRRALRRHFLFRPDAAITQLIVYSLAVSARRFGLHVHALCAMSTHIHVVVTDVRGVLPSFLQSFHRLVALGTKVLLAWEGSVWDHEPTSAVSLLTRAAIVEKIAYTLANPVAAGLVRHAHEWPGAKALVEELGRGTLQAARPDVYFDATNSDWPEVATLPLALPPGVEENEADGFRKEVAAELSREEEEARAAVLQHGVLGAERAATVSPQERATSFEAPRSRNPTFAVGRGNRDARRSASGAVRAFRAAYRGALELWRARERTVCFPVGTWWMRVLHAVNVSDVAPAG